MPISALLLSLDDSQKVYTCKGAYVRHHFAHDPSTPCQTDYSYQPESPHHREAKSFLLERLRKEFPEYKDAEIRCEVKMPEIKRVVDVSDWLATGP